MAVCYIDEVYSLQAPQAWSQTRRCESPELTAGSMQLTDYASGLTLVLCGPCSLPKSGHWHVAVEHTWGQGMSTELNCPGTFVLQTNLCGNSMLLQALLHACFCASLWDTCTAVLYSL